MSTNPTHDDATDVEEARSFDPERGSFDPPRHPSLADPKLTRVASVISTRRLRIRWPSKTVRAIRPPRAAARAWSPRRPRRNGACEGCSAAGPDRFQGGVGRVGCTVLAIVQGPC
jgi:hypothetical protein